MSRCPHCAGGTSGTTTIHETGCPNAPQTVTLGDAVEHPLIEPDGSDSWTGYPDKDPHLVVGKTIAAVRLYGFRHEIDFTDGTKLQIEPGDEDSPPEMIYQSDSSAD